MPDSLPPVTPSAGTFNADLRGVHYDLLKDHVPTWFTQASTQRQEELARHEMELPSWYLTATPEARTALANSHIQYRKALNDIEDKLGSIEDVLAFAEQPLKDAIKKEFDLDLDVKHVYFARKYALKSRDDLYGFFVFDQQKDPALSYEYRGMSLLEAALANFEPDEEQRSPCTDCHIITTLGAYDGEVIPTFHALKAQAVAIAPHAFAKLCRTLDLGELYQKHLKDLLQPEDKAERTTLEQQLEEYQRQQLALSTEIGRNQAAMGTGTWGISVEAWQMLKQVVTDQSGVTLDGKPVTFAALKVFDSTLVGPLMIGPDRNNTDKVERLLVYIPNDPQQPLKEYASSADFMVELRTRLHSASYRRFFSRFVPQREQGVFFQRFNALYQPASGAGAASDYPLQPTPAKLPLGEVIVAGNLWKQWRQAHVNKILADARVVAVPTGDEDRKARLDRLESYLDAVNSVFNLAAFVVPGLGPIMLAVGAVQMGSEVFEGIESYEQGDIKAMWAHFSSVALNVAFIGAGAKVLPEIKLSSKVDTLKPVTLANGKRALWNPDLSRYKVPVELEPNAKPDERGLFQKNGQSLLAHEGDHYGIVEDAGQYRIQHPTRPEAYQPVVEHNGAGTWKTELDEPLTWDKARLLRRLGTPGEQWPEEKLEQIRTVAGVSENELRRLHVELDPPPLMVSDTLKRFRLHAEASKVGQQILANQVPELLLDDVGRLMTDLPRWPDNRAVEVFDGPELKGPSNIIGNIDVPSANRIKLTRAEFRAGQLPQRTLETLSEGDIHELLGQSISSNKEVRVQALKEVLANQATQKHKRLFDSLYKQHELADGAQVQLLTNEYPGLPSAVAERLLQEATPADLEHLKQKQTIPLRLREQVRQAQHRVRVSRAYEGLYLDGLENNDTRRLELASLAKLPGWSSDVRIEIRQHSFTGKLEACVGPESASIRKVLILDEDGGYQARDESDQHLHGTDDFFASLLHALPDNERKSLGYDIFEGERLKSDVQGSPLEFEQFDSVLSEHPVRKPAYDPATMRLLGGMQGYRQVVDEPMLRRRLQSIYPGFSDEQVVSMLGEFGGEAASRISALETEFNELNSTLQRWMNSPTISNRFSPTGVAEWNSRHSVYKAIRQCWQRTGSPGIDAPGIVGPQHLILNGLPMNRHLANFPRLAANFDHVTSLSMRDANVLGSQGAFLENFPQLRALDLGGNAMNRLPPAIGELRQLTNLMLDNNQIALTPQAVARLRNMTRLEVLWMQDNPLGLVPDVSQMSNLQVLNLARTGIDQWPVGLFGKSRPRHIYLNLEHNRLVNIPEVAPGSFRAELLARTIVSREPAWMREDVLTKLKSYAESVGMDPERPYPPRGLQDSLNWAEGMPESLFRERLVIWDQLEDEIGSEKFFDVIRRLTESADFTATGGTYRAELTTKLWRLLEAMHEDSGLRETAFSESVAVTNCSDGASSLFNALGVRVLVKEAYALANPGLVEAELVELARGKSRLDEIGAIARRRIAERFDAGERFMRVDANGNPTGTIDEVEVQLAYMTDLAEKLDLPWQSRGMLFRRISGVTLEMIEAARLHILGLEQGDLLEETILQQPFWDDYLENTYRADIARKKLELINEDDMVQFNAIKDLKKTWTSQAIERAKLRRTEMPFTVQADS
ncbi:hypothetical protein PS838_00130 [Pseudomonas fluorescens]|nr:hypothetical protein PS838_00130 [Pseudomonas fluorescens]